MKRTRKLLVDAFFALLAEKSFQAITVQDIAERATVNRATFYAHFEDKFALMDWIVRDSFRDALQRGKAFYDTKASGDLDDPKLKRPVTWLEESLSRKLFDDAAERAFRLQHTVRQVRDAEAVRAILDIFEKLYR